MTKSMLSIFTVKPFLRVASCLALLATIMLIFPSIGSLKSPLLARGASGAESKKGAQADGGSSHTLVAPYYSVKGGLKATLMLSNQGPNEIPIRVRAYNRNGVPLDIADTKLGGNEVRTFDLKSYISEGSEFEEGSAQVEFQGRTMELGGLVILTDPAHSLIFEQELAEPAKDFASSHFEGVWWRPTGNSEVKLALTNTGNSMLSVTVATSGQKRGDSDSRTITLNPRETRILSTENHKNADELDLKGRIGGISISHTGTPGALLSCGFIQEESKGFSNVIVFSDPQKAKTTRLDGAGLRYGMVSGKKLSQIAVVRNVGSLPSIVSGQIPYTLADGAQSAISLPSIRLAPGEVEKIDLPDIQGEVKSAGLEFSYSTSPGSVIATALSVSQDRNHVFRLPVRDASDQRSSTGHYPWSIDDNSATAVYIKNATDTPKRYTMFVTYEGGYWAVGEKEIPGGQTVAYDLRDLRDNQVPNSEGHTIPLTATGGQVHWSIRGQEIRAMIGRAEQANTSNGTSTTSACGVCCPDNFLFAWLDPGSVVGFIGGVTNFIAWREDVTCYQTNTTYQYSGWPGWSCDNTSVATVDGSGQATAVGEGSTYIHNQYGVDIYTPNVEDCLVDLRWVDASASCTVRPTIAGPNTLWWFNGESPSGYATSIELATSAAYASYSWSIVSGADKIELVGDTTGYRVTVRSKDRSLSPQDCTVRVTVSGGVASADRNLTVRSPHTLLFIGQTNIAESTFGYESHINYRIRDQFTTPLPAGVPLNEAWITAVVNDYTGTNWRRGPAGSVVVPGSDFLDMIQGENYSLPPTPPPYFPGNPLSTLKVQHWGQVWNIGSTNIGSGRLVQINTLQKFLDHAEHTGITTPASP